MTMSEINSIKGIGEKTILKLLEIYKTISGIKTATLEELTEVIGKDKAEKVVAHFKDKISE